MKPNLIDALSNKTLELMSITNELGLNYLIKESIENLAQTYRQSVYDDVCVEKQNDHPFIDDMISSITQKLPSNFEHYPTLDEDLTETIVNAIVLAFEDNACLEIA